MKSLYLLLLGIFYLPFLADAQSFCRTEHSVDSLFEQKYHSFLKNKTPNEILPIPIQFHATQGSDGISNFNPAQPDSIISYLNAGFADTPFQFYKCGDVNFINDDDYATIYYYSEAAGQNIPGLLAFHNNKSAVNIYIAESIFAINISAWAYYPWSNQHVYFCSQSNYDSKTHIHEMGHVLGLYHTHHGDGEFVNGTNCLVKGDKICDTPAEPNLSGLISSDCEYTGMETDPFGEYYQPNVGNHMSYATGKCRKFFTEDQVKRMEFYYFEKFKKLQCDPDFEYTDIRFENLSTDPYPAVEGEEYDLIAKVNNDGNIAAKSIKIEAFRNGNKLSGKSIGTIHSSNPATLIINHKENFPSEAGRYEICIETEGDDYEINPFNNVLCDEIFIRPKEGMADLVINNVRPKAPIYILDEVNEILFDLENVGSHKASEISGTIYIDELEVGTFETEDIDIGEKKTISVAVQLLPVIFQDLCINIDPAFSEERLDNNSICELILPQEGLTADMEADSIYIIPNDSILLHNKEYTVYCRFVNNGEYTAWGNKLHLLLNDNLSDSIVYPSNYGLGFNPLTEEFDLQLPLGTNSIDICADIKAYHDTIPENNRICLTREVEFLTSTKEFTQEAIINLFPNPTSQILNVKSNMIFEEIFIYDKYGKEIRHDRKINSSHYNMNIEELIPAVYFVKIVHAQGTQFRPFVKI